MPRIRNFEQRIHLQEEVCTLHLSWDSVDDVMIHVNGNNVANTSDNWYALLVYCSSRNVSLKAVNRCNATSPSTQNITVVPQNFLYSEVAPRDVDVSTPPENQIEGYKNYYILYLLISVNLWIILDICYPDSSPPVIGIILGVIIVLLVIIIAALMIVIILQCIRMHELAKQIQKEMVCKTYNLLLKYNIFYCLSFLQTYYIPAF